MFTTRNLIILIGRHAAIAAGVVLVSVIASYFLANAITNVSNTVIQNRHLASTLEKRTELFSTLARDIQVIDKNDTFFEQAFLPSDNILEFISVLESIALKNGATQSFSFDTPSPSPFSSPFPISTIGYTNRLSLNVFTFTNYFKDFETLPYFTKIENLTITSGDPAGWRGASSVSFRATLYTKTTQ